MNLSPATWGLGTRLFVAQGVALVASVLTAGGLASIIGPPLFHQHLIESGHQSGTTELAHIEVAFASAGVVSLAVGLLVALALALAVSWQITRRLRDPLDGLADAATRISAGDYDTRAHVVGAGPELAGLGESFNRMAERLGSVEETRRRLLSDVAHEMRTPIAVLNAHLEALADGITLWDDQALGVLEQQTLRLTRLSRDLDNVSRAEEGRIPLDLERLNLAELLAGALAQHQGRFDAKGVRLHLRVEGQGVLVADPQRIAQILSNLLGNALRHTPAGGDVALHGRADEGLVVIAVSDTGEGMTSDQLAHIFERFYRGDGARERDAAGSGIGLTIARALARAHGGTLTAHSEGPGQGATFEVRLPASGLGR